jgi:hypothetical protein
MASFDEYVAWLPIVFGMLALTEGYHAFRQRVEHAERPGRYWWVAGLICGAGLGLIRLGFDLLEAAGG